MKQQQVIQKKQKIRQKTAQHTRKSQVPAQVQDHSYLQAQGIIGNHGVLRRHSGVIQAKLKVSSPGDKYEQEADRVAEQVMRTPERNVQRQSKLKDEEELVQTKPIAGQITPLVQRLVDDEFDKEEEEDELIQTKSVSNQAPQVTSDMSAQINAMRGDGQPLPKSTHAFFEPRFGYDLSQVRVHLDPEAGVLNDELHSRAFTHGRHIWLGRGEGTSNRRLLAHELAHTIQQGAAPPLEGSLREGASAAGVTLATPCTRPPGIQRSVQQQGVSSPKSVLRRIRRNLGKHKWSLIPQKLYYIANEFHPGKGVDLPSNAFVYTCRGGWIDMGHFFFTAFGVTALPGVAITTRVTWKKAMETEREQQRERTKFERMPLSEREKYFGRSWQEAKAQAKKSGPEAEQAKKQLARRGITWSAWTIEDVPSDMFGIYFGRSLTSKSDISKEMEKFFHRWGAVDARRNQKVLKRMIVETLGTKPGSEVPPRQHRSANPVLLKSACPLCPGAPVCAPPAKR